jgi:GAF domain-containing protein
MNPNPKSILNAIEQDEESMRSILLQNYLNGSLILGTIVFFVNLYFSIQNKNILSSALILLLFGALFLITFMQSWPSTTRSILLITIVFLTGVLSLVFSGLNANALLYFFLSVLLIGILLNGSWWFLGLFTSGITISLIGVFIQLGIIRQGIFQVVNNSLLFWLSILTILLFMIFVVIAPLNQYLLKIRRKILDAKDHDQVISNDNRALVNRVTTLETEIDRRRSRLIAARQISREMSQQTSVEKILSTSAELIRSQLGFSFTGVFLSDEKNEYAVLKSATGAVGKMLLSQNHQLLINEEGIVGFVIARGESRVTLDISQDGSLYKRTALPETRSEIAVPLNIGRKTIGAIDVQSEQENAFSIEDVEIIQNIADQLATVLDKTSQITEIKQHVAELEQGYGLFTRGVWRTHLKGSKKTLKYSFRDNGLSTAVKTHDFENEVMQKGSSMMIESSPDKSQNPETILSIPVKLRDQVLGIINIRYKGKKVPNNLISLIETATSRLAVTLENARLLEEIQERAEREHAVSEISSKVRASQDIDSILKTAVIELGKTLDIDEVSIQLKTSNLEK